MARSTLAEVDKFPASPIPLHRGYWGVRDVSAYLGIKASTIYAWAAAGKIPHYKIHGLLRFHPRELNEWVAAFHNPKPARHRKPSTRRVPIGIEELVAQAKRAVYTGRRGETRPKSSLIGKEEVDGAV